MIGSDATSPQDTGRVERPARLDAAAEAYATRLRWIGVQARLWGFAAGSVAGVLGWGLADFAFTVPDPWRALALPAVGLGGVLGWLSAGAAADRRGRAGDASIRDLERAAGLGPSGRFRAADELSAGGAGAPELRRLAVRRGDDDAAALDAPALADPAAVGLGRRWLLRGAAALAVAVALCPTAAWVTFDRAVRPLTELPGWTPHRFSVEPETPLIAGEPATLGVRIEDAPPWWVSLLSPRPAEARAQASFADGPPPVRASLVVAGVPDPLPLTRVRSGWAEGADADGGIAFRGRVAAPAASVMRVRVESDLGGSRVFSLPVDARPRVVAATATVTPPAYTGRPARTVALGATPPAEEDAGTEPHAELKVLEGSEVEVAFTTRVPLHAAAVEGGTASVEGHGGRLTRTFPASGDLALSLTGEAGAREALRLRVTAVPDAPPVAAVDLPTQVVRLAVSQTLDVPLSLRDDVAVAGAGYASGRTGPSDETAATLSPEEALATAATPRTRGAATAGVTISPAAMGLVPGDFLRGRVVAEDNRPAAYGGAQRSEPALFGVSIVSDEQMEALLRETRRVEQLLADFRALQDAVDLLEAERERLASDLASLAERAAAGATPEELVGDAAAAAAGLRRLAAASDALAAAFEERATGLSGYGFEDAQRADQAEQAAKLRGLAETARAAAEEQKAASRERSDAPGSPGAPGSVGAPAPGGSASGGSASGGSASGGGEASAALAAGEKGLRGGGDREEAEARTQDFLRLLAADELFGLRDRMMDGIRAQRALADEAAALRGKPPGAERDRAYADLAEQQAALEQEITAATEELRAAAEGSEALVPKLAGQALGIADAVEGLGLPPAFDEAIAAAGAGAAEPAAAATEAIASALEGLVSRVQPGPGQPNDANCLLLSAPEMQNALDQMAAAKRPGAGRGSGNSPGGSRGQGGSLAGGSGVGLAGEPRPAAGSAPAGRATSAAAAVAGVHAALAGGASDVAGRGDGSGPGAPDGVTLSGDVFQETLDVEASAPGDAASVRTLGVAPRYRRDAAAYFERLADEASAEAAP